MNLGELGCQKQDTCYRKAERCFRLANGPAGPRLADELEALGRALALEATEIEFAKEGGTVLALKAPLSWTGVGGHQ